MIRWWPSQEGKALGKLATAYALPSKYALIGVYQCYRKHMAFRLHGRLIGLAGG